MKGLIVKDLFFILFFYCLLLCTSISFRFHGSINGMTHIISNVFNSSNRIFFSFSAFLLHVTSAAVHIPASFVSAGGPI